MTEDLDKDEKYIEANTGILQPGELSIDYKRWIQSKEYEKFFGQKSGLTNAQHRFAEYLFSIKENITTIGDMGKIFLSIRQFLKHNQK